MSASQHKCTLVGLLKVGALAAYAVLVGGSVIAAAPPLPPALDIRDTPLFLTGGVKPNLIMAIDDSGSMDAELLLPTNDGAAWWKTQGATPGGCPAAGSYTGCVTDATGTVNQPGPGQLNFNSGGSADGTWKKYIYLFPNGFSDTDTNRKDLRRYADAGSDHYPVPPLGAFAWARSPDYNRAYFDPSETYLPWPNGGGYTFANANPTAARFDPVYPTTGYATINLTRDFAGAGGVDVGATCSGNAPNATANYLFRVYTGMTIPEGACIRADGWANWERVGHGASPSGNCVIGPANGCLTRNLATNTNNTRQIANNVSIAIRYFPATVYLSESTGGIQGYTEVAPGDGQAPDGSALYRYEIKPGNFSSSADYDAAIQNFANWFSYYRKRHQALRAGLGRAFETIAAMRISGFRINQVGTPPTSPNVTMRDIDIAADRNALYTDFYYNWTGNGGTPNRRAVANIIRNFLRTDGPVTASCQRNFGMLFTDGFSNAPAANDGLADASGNVDGSTGPYSGIAPYTDGVSNTMADHTMYGYSTVLRTGPGFPAGRVTVPAACADVPAGTATPLDCNPNLHMNFYAVTLGARGLRYDPDSPADPYATTIAWPTSFTDRHPSAVDDLWHATINGRGQLLNAAKSTELADRLSSVLRSIVDSEGSASAASVNSGSINSETRLFQVSFNTRDWSGELRAYEVREDDLSTPDVNEEGTLALNPVLATVPAAADRVILTVNESGQGVPFRWGNIGDDRQAQLEAGDGATLGSQRLSYLRGDQSNEQPGGTFRQRPLGAGSGSPLGDIVDSAPVFVGAPAFRYPDNLPEAAAASRPYSAFRTTYANRPRMVYVGGNDGMLHAFATDDAGSGTVTESFAYVPGAVYPHLHELSDPGYTHRFYVNGTPTVVDAFFGGDWHTVLVGGLNKGGKGVYALDVTNPATVQESGASNVLLWEVTNTTPGFADLGYTFSRPTIARVRDGSTGRWVAIFGNGYNSDSGKAVLYIVDVANGSLLKAIDVSTSPSTPPWRNGLSTPAVVDQDGDGAADFIYAGDLYGNMWKFDIRSSDLANWDVAWRSGASAPVPLFAAGINQPITVRPQVGPGPYGIGMVVLFGTGKYVEWADRNVSGPVQSFYGIYDSNLVSYTPPTRSDLQQQSVLGEVTLADGGRVRVTSDTPMATGRRGWYMDLPTSGERQISDPVLRNGRAVFTTVIPSSDPCSFGGSSWLMDVDALTGKRMPYSVFDLDRNTVFNEQDFVNIGTAEAPVWVPASGVFNDDMMSRPAFVAGQSSEYSFTTDTGGDVNRNRVNPGPAGVGRQSWRQLR